LRTGEGEMFNKTPDYKLQQIIHVFQELPPDFQDYVLQQIEQLKKLHKNPHYDRTPSMEKQR
jgi:hypothetical protein